MKKLLKSRLFTLNNIHYLCTENYYTSTHVKDFPEYQFEESTPEHISENLPPEIQNRIRELGDSYYTITIIPQEKVSQFSNKLKAYLREILDKLIKQQYISDFYLYELLPDLFQNLAALQDIDPSLKLYDLLALVTEIDKISEVSLSSQILF
jgi:hypothetical protein